MRWLLVAVVLLAIIVDLGAGLTGSSLTLMAGFGLVFAAERLFHDDTLYWGFLGGGVAVVLLALGLRLRRYLGATGTRRDGEQRALLFAALSSASLLVYGLSTDTVTGALGMGGDRIATFTAVIGCLWPILMLVGALPMVVIDRALSAHPIMLPMGATRRAMAAGLSAALGISLVFPMNYVANAHNVEWDVSYFKVSKPGTSTLALVQGLEEPVEAYLFYPAGSDVGRELRPYFEAIEAQSGGKLVVSVVDQAVDPKLAEDLKIRENGWVVFRKGEQSEKFKLAVEMDKARRDLKKLDETVQKNLLKISRGPRNAYILTGHGEASAKEKENPLRKLNTLKQVLEAQNFKVKNFGAMEGSAVAVPDDAAVLVISAPEKAMLPEEVAAVEAYLQRGGRLLILAAPDTDPMTDLTAWLGLSVGRFPVANAQAFLPQQRGVADRVLLLTNRFGTHEITSTLSKYSGQATVLLPEVAAITEVPNGHGKATVLLRSPENSWIDLDGDRQLGPTEKADTYNLAYAVSDKVIAPTDGGNKEWRAVVIGDVSVFADRVLDWQGNGQLFLDTSRWLVGDEDISGTIENEEDVKIEHTREEDAVWFYGTIFGVPLLVLGFGMVFTTVRRRAK